MPKSLCAALLIPLSLTAAVACGGDDDDDSSGSGQPPPATGSATAPSETGSDDEDAPLAVPVGNLTPPTAIELEPLLLRAIDGAEGIVIETEPDALPETTQPEICGVLLARVNDGTSASSLVRSAYEADANWQVDLTGYTGEASSQVTAAERLVDTCERFTLSDDGYEIDVSLKDLDAPTVGADSTAFVQTMESSGYTQTARVLVTFKDNVAIVVSAFEGDVDGTRLADIATQQLAALG